MSVAAERCPLLCASSLVLQRLSWLWPIASASPCFCVALVRRNTAITPCFNTGILQSRLSFAGPARPGAGPPSLQLDRQLAPSHARRRNRRRRSRRGCRRRPRWRWRCCGARRRRRRCRQVAGAQCLCLCLICIVRFVTKRLPALAWLRTPLPPQRRWQCRRASGGAQSCVVSRPALHSTGAP